MVGPRSGAAWCSVLRGCFHELSTWQLSPQHLHLLWDLGPHPGELWDWLLCWGPAVPWPHRGAQQWDLLSWAPLLGGKKKKNNKKPSKFKYNNEKTCNKKLVLQEADRVGGVFIICCISKYMKCQCEGNSFPSNKRDRLLN